MSDAIEVEINMMSSKRGRYKVEARNVKEEPQTSTSSVDPKFDSLMKVIGKLVDRLSIDNNLAARDNEPQIRNPNFRQPRKLVPPPP